MSDLAPITHPLLTAAGVLARQLDRLTGDDQMGTLFKAAAIFAPRSLVVPGWDA